MIPAPLADETAASAPLDSLSSAWLWRSRMLVFGLALLAVVVLVGALGAGPLSIPWGETLRLLSRGATLSQTVDGVDTELLRNHAVIWNLRLPRILLGFLSGGALALCGAALQGLFRNPLADPTLIGVSAGGALGAVVAIVLGVPGWLAALPWLAYYAVPLLAFLGALGATALVYAVASWQRRVQVATLLLAGIAMNAMAGSAIGWLTYIASDAQLRELSFWSLGSVSGAGWQGVWGAAPMVAVALVVLPRYARALNMLSLGEANAQAMGVDVQRVKWGIVVASAMAVGATVAFTGVIGFVGLIGPHLFRLVAGPDHRLVLPGSFLLGGVLLCLADVVARVAVAPAEIPVGIIVSSIGAPAFLYLLLREKKGGA